jgi:PAS domain S-box-containing protein
MAGGKKNNIHRAEVIGESRGINVNDFTEPEKVERTLGESESLFRQFFQLGLVGMAIQSPTGNWIEVNDRLCEIFGYAREELVQKRWNDLTHPDDLEGDVAQFEQLLQGKINHYSLEKRYIRKDGQIVHAMMSKRCIRQPSGDIRSIFVLVVDITELKQAEEALIKAKDELEMRVNERTAQLAESEEKHRLLVENASELIIVAQDGLVKFVNKRGIEPTGYSPEEMVEKPFLEFVHRDDRKLVTELYRGHMAGQIKSSNDEFRFISKDGSSRWAQMNAVRIIWEGRPAILAICTDITEGKRMEESLKAYARRITEVQEEERKRIAYELHDDTAQYLSILKMQLGALARSETLQNPEVMRKLRFLENDADRAFYDVRRYSHELRPVVLEYHGLLAALEQIAEDINKISQFKVDVNVEGKEPELSEEVKLGFFRIAQEALNNIRKHAKADRAIINLKFKKKLISMKIVDNGTGFDVRDTVIGSGLKGNLGLMSMRERADLIGARLNIDSKPGHGTTIRAEIDL